MSLSLVYRADDSATNLGTLAVTNANIGDAVICIVKMSHQAATISGISGGGCTTWTPVAGATWTDNNTTLAMWATWIGVVTSTGPSTITISYSGTPGAGCEIWAFGLTSDISSPTWSAVTTGTVSNNTSTTSQPWPTLTSGTAAQQAYFGALRFAGSPSSSGATSGGFTWTRSIGGNADVYGLNIATSSSITPPAVPSSSSTSSGVALIVSATGTPTTSYTAVTGAPAGVTALPGSLTKAMNAAVAPGGLAGFASVLGTLTIGLGFSGPTPGVIGLSAIPGVLTTSSPSNLALVAPALAEVGFAGQAAALEFDLPTTVSLAGFNASPGVLSATSADLNGNLGVSTLGASAVPGVLHFDVTGNTQYAGIPATFGEAALGGVVGLDIAGKPAGIFGYSGRAGRLRIGLGRDIDFTYGFADEDQWSFGRADA